MNNTNQSNPSNTTTTAALKDTASTTEEEEESSGEDLFEYSPFNYRLYSYEAICAMRDFLYKRVSDE